MIMATLAKKFRMRTSSGAVQLANIYSTPGEANNNTMRVLADNIAGYVAVGSIGDPRQTNGRVRKTNGVTYAILTDGAPAYGYGYYTSNGSFTVPSGVTKLRVTCVGGGAGGMVGTGITRASPTASTYTTEQRGFAGGTTTFGSVSAGGGSAAYVRWTSLREPSGEVYVTIVQLHSYAYSNGYHSPGGSMKSSSVFQGGAAVPLTNYAGTVIGRAGAGGYADNKFGFTAPGASGYRTVTTINVTPGQVIGYSIGAGSAWSNYGAAQGSTWNSGGLGGDLGRAGAILVEWGEGIQ